MCAVGIGVVVGSGGRGRRAGGGGSDCGGCSLVVARRVMSHMAQRFHKSYRRPTKSPTATVLRTRDFDYSHGRWVRQLSPTLLRMREAAVTPSASYM